MILSSFMKAFEFKKHFGSNSLRPYFSTNRTFENPLENATSYLVKVGILDKYNLKQFFGLKHTKQIFHR